MSQLQALLLSLVLELPVVLALGSGLGWVSRDRLPRLVGVALAATLLTHPFAWHGVRALRPLVQDFWLRAGPVEVAVALVEGLLYAWLGGLGLRRGLAVGFAANAFSFGLGLLVGRLLSV